MQPYVFIGRISANDGPFTLTTDESRITSDRDIYITPDEFVYLGIIKSEEELEWHFYNLDFCDKVDHAKFRRVWRMSPFGKLISVECNKEARDYLLNNRYKLPDDTKLIPPALVQK